MPIEPPFGLVPDFLGWRRGVQVRDWEPPRPAPAPEQPRDPSRDPIPPSVPPLTDFAALEAELRAEGLWEDDEEGEGEDAPAEGEVADSRQTRPSGSASRNPGANAPNEKAQIAAVLQRRSQQSAGPPVPAEPIAASAPEARGPGASIVRQACNWLRLHFICRRALCRQSKRCRGNAAICLYAGAELAPEPVRAFVAEMMQARSEGLSFEQAWEEADEENAAAWIGWTAGLSAASKR